MTQAELLLDTTAENAGKTPLMRQYYSIKKRHPNAILLFRMGDFYETFDDDAETVSRLLGITLTRRSSGKAADVPLAGFPHHALDTYLPRLVRAGFRVAICEQIEDPRTAKNIVKRDVVEVVTPGVSMHADVLSPESANYVAAVCPDSTGTSVGIALLDVSTGEFVVAESSPEDIELILESKSPGELLQARNGKRFTSDGLLTQLDDWVFEFDFAYETLTRHFSTRSLKGFGIDQMKLAIRAAGAALHYADETQKGRISHVNAIRRLGSAGSMLLDRQTKRNLELLSSATGEPEGSLISILDSTLTSMGARELRRRLLTPQTDPRAINARLDQVEAAFDDHGLRERLREILREISDLERLAARIASGRANPRDMLACRTSLDQVPKLLEVLEGSESVLGSMPAEFDSCEDIATRIADSIVDDPPASLAEGGVIRGGVSSELDELRHLAKSGKQWIATLQMKESQRTGISSLKVGYNRVFGYYLEVTNAHRDKVPDDYIRKQTLVNSERYITPELKEFEEKVLTAEEKILSLESRLFGQLRDDIAEHVRRLQATATTIGEIDVVAALAETAYRRRYVRPSVDSSDVIDIVDGRHPVVEQALPIGEPFIPNSIRLDNRENQILIVTGPNMAGKSVVLRQVGLIVLLGQTGSFVPARSAHIGVVDRIFTRVGASDNLAAGESTFLVEMNETANILNNATSRSLVLLDEVGRGTSTFDGMSIAWSLVEYLHEHDQVAARTLFATHYHELNELAERFPRVRNFRVQVQETEDKVVFLHKLVPGGADHSYGIEVARMAGLPRKVLTRAREILHALERKTRREPASDPPPPAEAKSKDTEIADELRELRVDEVTPLEALVVLDRLSKAARS